MASADAVGGGVASILVARREAAAPMVPTLVPLAASESQERHVPEDIPRVLPLSKSQDRDAHGVFNRSAFVAVAVAAASVRVVVALKAETAYSASVTTSTSAASTGLCDLCHHSQLNSHHLGDTRGWGTGRRAPHVPLPDEGSEGGVQLFWAVIGE